MKREWPVRKHFAVFILAAAGLFSGAGFLPAAEITLTDPAEGVTVSQHNRLQKMYLTMPQKERIAYFANPEKRREMKSAGYYPVPVKFAWKWDGAAGADFTVTVSASRDFEPGITVKTKDLSAEVGNLKINQQYYWKVSTVSAGETIHSKAGVFQTEDQAPRLLRIDGVPNVRDLGGRKAMDGKRVRQGLVYRTAGLNDNASCVYYTWDELPKTSPEYAKIARQEQQFQKAIEAQKERLRGEKDIPVLPYGLGPVWTVFRPDAKTFDASDYSAELEKLTVVPNEFMGAKPEKAVADSDGVCKFAQAEVNAPAIFIQEFESPQDGCMQLGCGADWFWDFRINGEKVYDKLAGNTRSPVSAGNFRLQIPVRKGKNLAVVLVRSGSAGWAWCCAARPAASRKEMLNSMIRHLEDARKNLCKVEKERKAGRNRLNPAMKRYLLEDLGIKSDIDLRSDGECWGMKGSPLGDAVTWFHCSSSSYGGMQSAGGKAAFAKVFKVFLDRKNYPILFHCIAGQDRTGSLAFILNGLLGVETDELYLDWEATGFWNGDPAFCHEKRFDSLVKGFETLPGATMREKIENYVLGLGFTQKDIETFRSYMLE